MSNSSVSTCGPEPWREYPFNLASYNPLSEWGELYDRIFKMDIWALETNFILHDLNDDVVSERRIFGTKSVDDILEEDPDVRVFYCDSKLCDDLVTRASFTANDIKKIFHKYDLSIIFVDRFIGRNRCTTGSRKLYDPDDPSRITSYDVWYDLPSRIYGAEHEYNWHFILFTVYVHYDAIRKKTVLFYIHRLGSEHPSSAEMSSGKVKERVRTSLEHVANNSSHITALKNCPFIIQQSTLTSSIIFWTETLHKERLSMWNKEDDGKKDIANIDTFDMHNITRYVYSYAANIEILQRTLHFVKAEHMWFSKNAIFGENYRTSPWYQQTIDTIESQMFQIDAIVTWTQEVLKRTKISIELVSGSCLAKEDSSC